MNSQGNSPEGDVSNLSNNNGETTVENLRQSFHYLPIATLGLSELGEVTYSNLSAQKLFELDQADLVQKNLRTFCGNSNADNDIIERLLKGANILNENLTLRLKDEKRILISSGARVNAGDQTRQFVFLRDVTQLKKKEYLFSYLNKAATTLAKVRETTEALRQIGEFIVPSFANWFTVDQIRENKLELILLMHDDPAKIEWAREYRKKYPADLNGHAGPAVVVKTGQPAFVPVVTEQMIDLSVPDPIQKEEVKKIGLHSVIMAPIWTEGKITGLVNFISSRPDRHFDDEDLDFALNFANLIGLALHNTELNADAQHELFLRTESEQRLKFLLDAIPHKMWTSGPDGRATFYNKRWHEYTGIDGFENLREKVWGIIHPDDLELARQKWPEAIRTGIEMEMEHRLLRHDGEYRWHLSRFTAHKREEGQVTLWVGTSTDIHDQKIFELELAAANEEITSANEELFAANEELETVNEEQSAMNEELRLSEENLQNTISSLETSQERFRTFMDSIPQIAWASSANGEVLYYNRRWYDYTGLSFEETKDWGWKQIIHPDDIDYNIEQLTKIIQSKKAGEFEIREKRLDGNYRWHLVRISPLVNASGELEQWIGTATDIDELKKLQQQKDDFISIASHELKTPLTTLKSSVQLLYKMKDELMSDKFTKLIEQTNRSMHKMSVLVNDLLNVSRIKETQLPLQKKWFILSEIVNACCNHITVAGKYEIVIVGDKTLRAYADENAIDQVIVNFVNNAMKYASESKHIFITIQGDESKCKLSVTDNGPGISEDSLPFLFDRYYQGGKQDYRNPGLGLGLYICSEIVKRHGGEIGVESKPGHGSTFWFTLPGVPSNN